MLIKLSFPSSTLISIVFSILLATTYSCSSSEENSEIENKPLSETTSIVISQDQFNSSDMKLGTIKDHTFKNAIKSYGSIDVPPENKASISAYFGGYVKKLNLLEGQKVLKGQILFTLENPEYIEIQQEYLETKGKLTYLKSDYDRQKNLVADSVTSQKVYLKSESEYKVALVRYESLKKKLFLMNIDPNKLNEENIRSEINVTAPISGFIATIKATQGMFLNRDDIALTIINTDHIHLELNVFEKDLPKIQKGQEIRFQVQNEEHFEYKAEVHLVGNYIDPIKRSASIHGHLINEEESYLFTPGMYIEAEIFTSQEKVKSVPNSALISKELKSYVLVKVGEEGDEIIFEQRELIPGLIDDGFTAIKNIVDFSDSDQILNVGAFNLIAE